MNETTRILIAEIQSLYEDGYTVYEIAWGYGLAQSVVRAIVDSV